MKNLIILVLLALCSNSLFGQVTGKKYILSKYSVIANNDTVVYYNRDSLQNIWDLNNIEYVFNSNESYLGKTISGSQISGTWKRFSNKFITDSDTSDVVFIDTYRIEIKNRLKIKSNDSMYEGDVITELINYIYSIKTGNWNDISTWSCNCIPHELDNVLIRSDTKVILTNTMGIQKCKGLTVEKGAIFENSGTFFLSKP